MSILKIKVDDNGKIVDAKFKTFGCGSAIASSSLATEWVKGKQVSIEVAIRTFFGVHLYSVFGLLMWLYTKIFGLMIEITAFLKRRNSE